MDKFEETASIILICDISFLPLIWSLKKKKIHFHFSLTPYNYMDTTW